MKKQNENQHEIKANDLGLAQNNRTKSNNAFGKPNIIKDSKDLVS